MVCGQPVPAVLSEGIRVVDSTICSKCSSPVSPGEAFCANCGAPLDDPASSVASGEPGSHDPVAPPVHMPGSWELELGSLARETSAPQAPDPEPADDAADHVPGGYLPPSATYRGSGWTPPERGGAGPDNQSAGPRMSESIGAVPVAAARIGSPMEPAQGTPQPAPAAIAPATPQSVTPPIGQSRESLSARASAATPAATVSGRKETVQELAAIGLVAAGGVVGFASFFLPWAGSTGIGIGTVAMAGSPPEANQWAWGMPAAMPLFLLTGLILGAAAGSDRAQQRLPELAPIIARVTDVMLPMLLSGLYFGVGLLYLTLPYGFGTGIFVLIAGACLLLAGSIVALFLPPKDDPIAG
jgi:hypothetical protein